MSSIKKKLKQIQSGLTTYESCFDSQQEQHVFIAFKITRSYWGPHQASLPNKYPGFFPRRQSEATGTRGLLPPPLSSSAVVKKVCSYKTDIFFTECVREGERELHLYLTTDLGLDFPGSGQNPVAELFEKIMNLHWARSWSQFHPHDLFP